MLLQEHFRFENVLADGALMPVTLLDMQFEVVFAGIVLVAVGVFHVLLFVMNCRDMPHHSSVLSKSLTTNSAWIRFLLSVGVGMVPQVGSGLKSFTTCLADKRMLSSMQTFGTCAVK